MSRVFTDRDLLTWEVYASGGPYGMPQHPSIVFHCLSDPDLRARFIRYDGDNADAQRAVTTLGEDELQQLLERTTELD